MGYYRAGFDIVGVDINPQPRYPFTFIQADALVFARDMGWAFDAIHASPPCQDHSPLRSRAGVHGTAHLLSDTRDLLLTMTAPWIIENVMGAPMRRDLMLCGEWFGLRTVRHRRFELSGFTVDQPPHPNKHKAPTSTKNRVACLAAGYNISVTGDVGVHVGPLAMGIDWMRGDELSQAIPPAYTEYIGQYLMKGLR
jgi:DNA (cytosine-5)-methyltransferase 1